MNRLKRVEYNGDVILTGERMTKKQLKEYVKKVMENEFGKKA